jgi:stage II sporulation protein AA (anti-sigma F factor antagonist)
MQIAESRMDGIVAVAPVGRIDTTTAPALEKHVIALVAGGERRIVVDFTGVDYISSAGLRVMLLLARRLQDAGGRLGLCGMGDAVRQVFQLAGFLPLFAVLETREAAVRQLARP